MTEPSPPPAPRPPFAAAAVLGLEALALGLAFLLLAVWFAGWPASLSAGAVLAALAAVLGLRLLLRPRSVRATADATPAAGRLDLWACLALAVAYRMPALLHPWGFVNRDGAYGAFVGLHMLQGLRPVSPFTEGANYQGTLKSHLAALLAALTGARDWSFLLVASSLLLYLVFLAATVSLARRVGGRAAALGAGLYLALAPRFLTVFSLNCVGQYVDVLALGGLALAVLARLLGRGEGGREARHAYLGLGALLGAAFWAQPVALAYVLVAAVALGFRRRTWRDPWVGLVAVGLLLGVLPMLLWNLQNDWASREILFRQPGEVGGQVEGLPRLLRRTATISFPILSGLSPGHAWGEVPGVSFAAAALVPAAALAYLGILGRRVARARRLPRLGPSALAPLLLFLCLGLFLSMPAGKLHRRPRYLLPLSAATAVHLGVAWASLARRSRLAGAAVLLPVLALNARGTLPRMAASASVADYHRAIVRSLEDKGIRTGYADFSVAGPVTMFTAEGIVLSPALGPTPAYFSEIHERRVEAEGPDAFVLLPGEDPDPFASRLDRLGVSYRLDRAPLPVFHSLSRRVRLEEVVDFREETGVSPLVSDVAE